MRGSSVGLALLVSVCLVCPSWAQFGRRGGNPFAPPEAHITYAPDRTYDLQNVRVELKVNYEDRSFSGTATETLAPISDGLAAVKLQCGDELAIDSATVDGKSATCTREGETLTVPLATPGKAGKPITVVLEYHTGKNRQGGGFLGGGGWHWIQAPKGDPDHCGFWTQGEEMSNHHWLPIWDYPNDFTTSEEIVTVPEGWYVVGNGDLVSNSANKAEKTRTFHWRMRQSHATYLISLAAGPMDIKWTSWQGVKLLYAVPKGKGNTLDGSFGDTPDMLSCFSRVTGVKYAWTKYAQTSMYDFGGGMENVSATTLDTGSLNTGRDGVRSMASLNSHELAHQWFGDLVTCRDWGQVWLNESFATFFEIFYMEHSRGKNAYDQEIESNSQSYFNEARQYVRPLATKVYSNTSSLFDRHAYPKGGVVLHTLRRQLGDTLFFAGLQRYLEQYRGTPVVTHDLIRAMTDATGVNVEPFFDQWVFKPGHPVLDYTWSYDEAARKVVVTVKQVQDTEPGTPIYTIDAKVGIISGGKLTRLPARLDAAQNVFSFDSASKPDAVMLDPDHDFLRELVAHWAPSELLAIARYAPDCVERQAAAARLLNGTPSEEAIQGMVAAVRADKEEFPAFNDLGPLAGLAREDLRPFWRELLGRPGAQRKAAAIRALAALKVDRTDLDAVAKLVDQKQADPVIDAAVQMIAAQDPAAGVAALARAARLGMIRNSIRGAALAALAGLKDEQAIGAVLECAQPGCPKDLRASALKALGTVTGHDDKVRAALKAALTQEEILVALRAVEAATARGDKELLPMIAALETKPPTVGGAVWADFLADAIREAKSKLK